MSRDTATIYSRSSCTFRIFTSTGNVVPSFRRCTLSMIANPGSHNCCRTHARKLSSTPRSISQTVIDKSSSRLYPSSAHARSFESRKRRVSGSVTRMASFDWSSSVRNRVRSWSIRSCSRAVLSSSSLVACSAFFARTSSVTSCAMPRTTGFSTPSVRSVLWYSQSRRSPVRVITAITP